MIAKAVRHRAAFLMPGNSKGAKYRNLMHGFVFGVYIFCMVPGVRP